MMQFPGWEQRLLTLLLSRGNSSPWDELGEFLPFETSDITHSLSPQISNVCGFQSSVKPGDSHFLKEPQIKPKFYLSPGLVFWRSRVVSTQSHSCLRPRFGNVVLSNLSQRLIANPSQNWEESSVAVWNPVLAMTAWGH